MPADLDRDALIDMIAEGLLVDWAAVLRSCTDGNQRALIEQLRVVASVARVAEPPQGKDLAAEGANQRPSRAWGPLDVFDELGRGAFGCVYRARDRQLDREVALKLVDPVATANAPFVREA